MGVSLLFAGVLLLWASDSTAAFIKEWPITDLQHLVPPSNPRGNSVPLTDPPYHAAGYIHPENTEDAKLFYFYFQERNKSPDAPLLFWTNGGPGCSSMLGLFTENGPYKIQEDLTLRWSEFGWDIGQNIIFVDQPVGTGFSYSHDTGDYVHYEAGVGADMLAFFVEFLEIHPELKGKDFYLSGESYAGHYLPAIADSIHKNADSLDLKLKGVLMGNPMTNPLAISLSYPKFAEANGLISKKLAASIREEEDECIEFDRECQATKGFYACYDAAEECNLVNWDPVIDANPDINYYDIRKKCAGSLCYDYSLITKFLNDPGVQKILGVHKRWSECTSHVMREMYGDLAINMGVQVRELLNDGIRFMVYVGDQDLICNWMGNKAWLDGMAWDKSSKWTGKLSDWGFTSKSGQAVVAGQCEATEPLTFCRVYQAGHMVPTDQPEAAFDIVRRFIDERKFVPTDSPTAMDRSALRLRERKIITT
ncbi:hypothetical protein BSKO_09032 [Bryopsis sp. KO-2023]|nr:hypothetical protein BSKO_09032 [Bryopsis sp. KO-2023]